MSPTVCPFCNKEINENSDQNKGKKYLLCKCNHGFVAKGSKGKNTDFTEKEVIEMPKKSKVKPAEVNTEVAVDSCSKETITAKRERIANEVLMFLKSKNYSKEDINGVASAVYKTLKASK